MARENVLVDGIQDIYSDETPNVGRETRVACCRVGRFRTRANEIMAIMAEELHTSTHLFCVMDGCGELGDFP